jgi:hypothetical protein
MAKAGPVPKMGGLKAKLILVTIVSVLAVYMYFSYQREFFPFTKENKKKILSMVKGKGNGYSEEEEEALEEQIKRQLEEGYEDEEGTLGGVDELGSLKQPKGGTGGIPLESGGLKDPVVKGDEEMTATYQQQLFRQLFMPYETDPYGSGVGDLTQPFSPIARGGDLPSQRELQELPSLLQHQFPIDERLYELYGLFPPGGTYRPVLGDYPYYWGYPSGSSDEDEDEDEEANRAKRIRGMYSRNKRYEMARGTIRDKQAFLGTSITPNQKQFAFSKLQHKASHMNRLHTPVIKTRAQTLESTLPPVVARRHMATPLRMS